MSVHGGLVRYMFVQHPAETALSVKTTVSHGPSVLSLVESGLGLVSFRRSSGLSSATVNLELQSPVDCLCIKSMVDVGLVGRRNSLGWRQGDVVITV